MDDNRWIQLIADIQGDNIEAMVEACDHLQNEAEPSDVPRLLQLLQHESFVVREAASWPLAIVGGSAVLPELFTALQRGYGEGLDNDGLQTALVELVQLHPEDSREKLLELKNSSNQIFQEYADWLLEFC
ncbi:MAG: HEAT repeat domain-containing protein [Pyrinomonadaceae bacterium]